MAIYYIADTHFGHASILNFDNRPYSSVEEMEQALITNWNACVTPQDEVRILGDFCWGKEKDWIELVPKLNGKKILIKGNHDLKGMNKQLRSMFQDVADYKVMKDGYYTVVLSHYPILAYPRSYDPFTVMLHGHTHYLTKEAEQIRGFVHQLQMEKTGRNDNCGFIYNVGCMVPYMDYTPRTLEEILSAHSDNYFTIREED